MHLGVIFSWDINAGAGRASLSSGEEVLSVDIQNVTDVFGKSFAKGVNLYAKDLFIDAIEDDVRPGQKYRAVLKGRALGVFAN